MILIDYMVEEEKPRLMLNVIVNDLLLVKIEKQRKCKVCELHVGVILNKKI